MNCNKTIETNVTEETFIQEIEKAKKCIAKVLNIDIKNIDEFANEDVIVKLNKREKTLCNRRIFHFQSGSLDCYMSKDLKFIEIFHHPN